MGFLFLSIALLAGAAKGYCGKKTSSLTSGMRQSLLANIIRISLCIIIGFIVILIEGNVNLIVPNANLLLISALSGVSTAIFVVSWLISVRKSAYMLMDVFLMLGILIPLILSLLFFKESIRITQWIGLIILFVATFIMCSYNNSIKTKLSLSSYVLLIICGFSNGITDFSQKLFIKSTSGIPVSIFNFYTYIFAFITLIIAFCLCKNDNSENSDNVFKNIGGYIFIMAICLFLNSYFKTLAAKSLSSIILYPLNQGLALILSSLMSSLLFKEKLTAKAITGIMISFVGLLIINMI